MPNNKKLAAIIWGSGYILGLIIVMNVNFEHEQILKSQREVYISFHWLFIGFCIATYQFARIAAKYQGKRPNFVDTSYAVSAITFLGTAPVIFFKGHVFGNNIWFIIGYVVLFAISYFIRLWVGNQQQTGRREGN